MSSNIPTIDLSHCTESLLHRQQIASEIDNALRSVGFIYLLNHGIDQAKIDTYFEWSKRFFSLSNSTKETLCPDPRSSKRGYCGVGKEQIRGQICTRESFGFCSPRDDTATLWPKEEQLPEFHDFAADFHEACTKLIEQLLRCLDIALSLGPEDSLSQYHTGSMFVSSLIHYPAVSLQRLRSGEAVRGPAHSDTGTLTLLFQHQVGGLEIADMSSTDKTATTAVEQSTKFIHIDPKPGTVVVNVGYLLMRWTNGRWKNTVHRVREPPGSNTTGTTAQDIDDLGKTTIPERYSVAFFTSPDEATTVDPLPSCCSSEEPKKWGPVNVGDYLLRKRAMTFSSI